MCVRFRGQTNQTGESGTGTGVVFARRNKPPSLAYTGTKQNRFRIFLPRPLAVVRRQRYTPPLHPATTTMLTMSRFRQAPAPVGMKICEVCARGGAQVWGAGCQEVLLRAAVVAAEKERRVRQALSGTFMRGC